MPRDASKCPPKVTHYTDDPTRWPWPDNPCHSHVLGWDRFTDTWALVSCAQVPGRQACPRTNIGEAADMTEPRTHGRPLRLLALQRPRRRGRRSARILPEYHDVCGYGPLQWSGQLFDRGSNWIRTYELRATRE